jgi:hypothetical protein
MAEHTVLEETRDFITRQRGTLLEHREAILAEQRALQKRLDEVDEMLAKFAVFEGKPSPRHAKGPASPGARRGSKREAILAVLSDNPRGLSRGEIVRKLGLKGNKSGEMSVYNALTGLSKNNQVVREDGKYLASVWVDQSEGSTTPEE